MPDSFQVEAVVGAEPARVYQAWMDSREHAAFTGGGEAVVEPWAGGRFTAWDGYIHGILLQVDVGTRIVQTWRTSEFLPEPRDSRLVVEFEPARGGTTVRIRHADLPPSQMARYELGWMEHYLKPLQQYFSRGARKNELTAAPKALSSAWERKPVRAKKGAEAAQAKAVASAAGTRKAAGAKASVGKAAGAKSSAVKSSVAKASVAKKPDGKKPAVKAAAKKTAVKKAGTKKTAKKTVAKKAAGKKGAGKKR